MNPAWATTPCPRCGQPTVLSRVVRRDGSQQNLVLDPSVPTFLWESDGEGGHVWIEDTSSASAVSHALTCPQGVRRGGGRGGNIGANSVNQT